MSKIQIKVLDERVSIPKRATDGSAGFDLQACIDEELILLPGESKLIPTGLAIHIDKTKIVGFILPRSKLGAKTGIVLGNLTGVIDSDYQGQWFISVWNRNFNEPVRIQPLEEIAQAVFLELANIEFNLVDEFDKVTSRAGGGISKNENTGTFTCSCGSTKFMMLFSTKTKRCYNCGKIYSINGIEIKHQRG